MQKSHKDKWINIVFYVENQFIMQKMHRNRLIYAKFA